MRSKNKTSAEKAWHNTVAQFGRESGWLNKHFGGYVRDPYQFHIDHILGAQAKRKVDLVSTKVGEWAVIPLPIEIHDYNQRNPVNKSTNPEAYKQAFGSGKELFADMIKTMQSRGIELPFDEGVFNAIMS